MSTPPGHLFIVSAPSGGGKTSLTRALIPRLADLGYRAEISVSWTTRAPRPGEQEGVHYHFVDQDRFLAMIDQGEFLEHAEVFGRRYGTSATTASRLLEQGIDVILDIDWQGARQVRQTAPDAKSIFILPPSLAALEQRLRARGQDDEQTIRDRMALARDEMSHWPEYGALIVNDQFERALDELTALFVAPRLGREQQSARHCELLEQFAKSKN